MYEEEFEAKHMDIITQHLDKHLGGFPKRVWGDNGTIEYIFEGWYHPAPGRIFGDDPPPKIALAAVDKLFGLMSLTLTTTPDKERVKITIVPSPARSIDEMISDLKSKITWSGAITCPNCKANYVYKDEEKESGSVTCKNCAKEFEIN
jgi:hypothetical protein